MPSSRVFGFQIWNDNLVKFKQSLGLPLGKKFDINIPKIFLSKPTFSKAVVRGIFDTDGGIYLELKNNKLYPRLYITTISFNLANDLISLLKKLGFRATIYSGLFNDKFNRQRAYSVNIRGADMFKKFMRDIGLENPKHIQKYDFFLSQKF